MGCIQSKAKIIKEKDNTFPERPSSSFESSVSLLPPQLHDQDSADGCEEGRLGIRANNTITFSSSSSSSDNEDQPEYYAPPPFHLIEKCAPERQNMNTIVSVSDDSSSSTNSTPDNSNVLSSRAEADVTLLSNQSMDDNEGDEDVVDWLNDSTSSATSLTTSNSSGEKQLNRHTAATTHHWAIHNHNDDGEHVAVMDTTKADRRHVPLPENNKSLVKKGDWLSNRYKINDYIILSEIGSGAHSVVRLAKHKTSNHLFAVKIMTRKVLQSKVDYVKEVEIMKKMSTHQNILRLIEVIDDCSVNKVYLVTELAERGDLMNIIKSNAKVDCLRNMVRQMMNGLLHIHDNYCTHNDIKPSNILLTRDETIKISDFGISSLGRRVRIEDSAGTPAYSSPEVLCGEPHDGRLADCYSLGATIYHLVCKEPPFVGVGGKILDLFDKIKYEPLRFPSGVDSQLMDLISGLMHKDPMQRMPLTEALNHQWLES